MGTLLGVVKNEKNAEGDLIDTKVTFTIEGSLE